MNDICIFCSHDILVIRHVDTEVYQVVCPACGMCGPYGKCRHEAKEKYRNARLDNSEKNS